MRVAGVGVSQTVRGRGGGIRRVDGYRRRSSLSLGRNGGGKGGLPKLERKEKRTRSADCSEDDRVSSPLDPYLRELTVRLSFCSSPSSSLKFSFSDV